MVMNKILKPLNHLRKTATAGLIALTCYFPSQTHAAGVQLDQIAAIVNNDVIMLSEANRRAQILRASDKAASALSPQALLKRAVDDLILENLQVQKAADAGIQIDDVTLNKTMEALAQQNKMDLATFQQALQHEGINYTEFREQTRRKLMADALRKSQLQTKVSGQEVEDLIASQSENLTAGERYHLYHILIPSPNDAPITQANAVLKRAEQIRLRLLRGEDFLQVAKTESDSAASQNGDLGWQEAAKLPASFNRALALMQPGEISAIVRDPAGFHIFKLVERQGGSEHLSAEELRSKATTYLGERKADEQYQAWLQGLRNSAYVEYRIPLENTTGLQLN